MLFLHILALKNVTSKTPAGADQCRGCPKPREEQPISEVYLGA